MLFSCKNTPIFQIKEKNKEKKCGNEKDEKNEKKKNINENLVQLIDLKLRKVVN
jgi:hypothetical protein